MKKYLLPGILLVSTFLFTNNAEAKLISRTIEYKEGSQPLEGYLAYDDRFTGKRPGVLVVHEWKGLNDYAKMRANMLAGLGYVAFAADIYGKGIRPQGNEEAGKLAGKFKGDRKLLRARANAGLNVLKSNKLTNTSKLAAIGYCFGGTTVLELARSGAPVKGVVSFHGGLDTPTPGDAKNIKGAVLAHHGADDPNVPEKDVLAFQDEMRKAGVDWQFVSHSNAVHGFTNPANGTDNSKGVAYNAKADKRSWQSMVDFFKEIFK
jgi:dienelactone hydrolase